MENLGSSYLRAVIGCSYESFLGDLYINKSPSIEFRYRYKFKYKERLVEEVECSAPLPKSVKNMFKGFLGTKLKLVNFDTHNVTNMSGMFLNCKNLTKLDLGDSFDTSNVISVEHMFEGCENLERLYLGDLFNTRNVKYFGSMFSSCLLLRALSLGKQFSMVNVEDTTFMFNSTASLEFLRLPRGDVYLKLCSSINTNYLPELRIHYL